ncbi:MAG TPA: hypothetical protein VF656_13170 [Pyrinomonadaceae bacterium]
MPATIRAFVNELKPRFGAFAFCVADGFDETDAADAEGAAAPAATVFDSLASGVLASAAAGVSSPGQPGCAALSAAVSFAASILNSAPQPGQVR